MEYLLVALVILGSIGATLLFVGGLFAVLTAFGNKQYVFGALMLLFLPLSLVYCALNWDKAAHSGKLVYAGLAVSLICLAAFVAIGGNPFLP